MDPLGFCFYGFRLFIMTCSSHKDDQVGDLNYRDTQGSWDQAEGNHVFGPEVYVVLV